MPTQAQTAAAAGSVSGTWKRTATADLTCTTNGAATAGVTLPGTTARKTARLTITCADAVSIAGLADTTATGTGQVRVARAFTVTPATAACTVAHDTARVTGTGANRTLSATLGSPATLRVTVTCRAADHIDAVRRVALTAASPPCTDHLGTLAAGRISRTGAITADARCTSSKRRPGSRNTYYTSRHTFTLAGPATVTIDLGNGSSNRRRLDTYLILLNGHGGAGTVVAYNDDGGPGTDSRLSRRLAPGDYTIEAATYYARRTGNYNLTVNTTPACTDSLGTLTAGRTTRTGTVAATAGCTSAHRGTNTTRPATRWHTFTLDKPAWIDIDLAAATGSSLNPYLLLLSGHGSTGRVIAQDDNSGTGNAARIQGRHLEAGSYTIEATANTHTGTAATGNYTLTVTVPIHGLAQAYETSANDAVTVNFTYWPVTRSVSFGSRNLSLGILYDYFGFGHSAASGSGSVTVRPNRGAAHDLKLTLGATSSGSSQSGAVGQSAVGTAATRQSEGIQNAREYQFRVLLRCGRGEKLSPNNDILCVDASTNVEVRTRGKETPVTTGVLLAIDDIAEEAVRLYAGPCSNWLTVKPRQIATLMLAIAIYEIAMTKDGFDYRYPARSAMGLSRQDYGYPFYYSRERAGTFGPSRAFWHVGVGMFQLDDRFADNLVNSMTHAERADIRVGGKLVAKHLVQKICERPTDPEAKKDFISRATAALGPWHGCRKGGENKCLTLTYPKLYIARGDDLYVTNYLAGPDPSLPANSRVPTFPHDERENYSELGGIKTMRCRWDTNRSHEFDCYFYDTENPEGWFDRYLEDGARVRQTSPSPLAAPFFSVTGRSRRAVVFPASFLGSPDSWFRSVPFTLKIHQTAEKNRYNPNPDARFRIDWTRNSHDFGDGMQRTLEVRTLARSLSDGGPRCGWVSVNDRSSEPTGQNLARCVRYMYPNQN